MTAEPGQPLRILLAEDHRTLREGLRLLLAVDGDLDVVAEVEAGIDAVARALELRPDVVLMDVSLVGIDGIEATRRVRAQAPEVRVLILSAHPDLHLVRAALDAGACGYLLKRASGDDLRRAVRAAAAGERAFSPEVAARLPEVQTTPRRDDAHLTGRETEILELIARGHSNREIAQLLGISAKTVDTHRTHLMAKLDIHDVTGLVRYAIRKGLIES